MIQINEGTKATKLARWYPGITVAKLLKDFSFRQYIVVRIISGKETRCVSRPNFEKTELSNNDILYLIPLIVGG